MKSYVKDDRLVIAISHQETCRLNNGEVIADRRSPLWLEAKVEVHPFADYNPTYQPVEGFGAQYQERLAQVRCVAMFFSNLDLEIYVPPEVSRHAFIGAEHIAVDDVITIAHDDERQALLGSLPYLGVTIRFDDI